MYHAQVTRAQGVFSIRSVCNGWGLQFIAANLGVPTTVLHYPTRRRFIRELRKGYDFVGISFVMCTFPKAIEMCRWVREEAPDAKLVLGGYGTVLSECDQYADYVCREEGVNFFKRLLGEEEVDRYRMPVIRRTIKVLSVTPRPESILTTGLGCSRGCDFCCTSHFFNRRSVPLLRTGRELHQAMRSVDPGKETVRNIGIIDEDFLADGRRIGEMIPLNASVIDKPIFFSCLTSLRSLTQYTTEELLRMGLSGAWVGVESQRADYPKLHNIDAGALLDSLKRVGIITLTSIILGYDWHDEETVEEDFQYLLSLEPTFSQIMIYSPCPQTPLYARMQEANRLRDVPYKYHDGFHALFEHPNLSAERLEALVGELFRREYEELGPSVCRVLDVQLTGYTSLRDSEEPLFRRRAEEYKRLCLEIYPLLKPAIKEAPSDRVRVYLRELKERTEDTFRIPRMAKLKERMVPILVSYTRARQSRLPVSQPPSLVEHYHLN
jgi:haloalkane dehalogenase